MRDFNAIDLSVPNFNNELYPFPRDYAAFITRRAAQISNSPSIKVNRHTDTISGVPAL